MKLRIENDTQLERAYEQLIDDLGPKLAGVLVQRMAGDGVEMFVGGLQDPAFGPVVFCGSGGVLVELFGDAVCRLCPLTDRDAEEMLNEIRGVARLRGHRGKAAVDEAALRDALVRVSVLLHACPEIREMDINPLNVRTSGVAALDVRIRVEAPAPSRSTRRVRY